jgi:type I restriction enzyme R subunit
MGEFKSHLPQESLARIEGGDVSGARVQFATYPSVAQVFSRLSPGYYDLIIADESHRSIYQRYKAIFEHFDALQLGLTATPTDYIDHNTFTLFGCEDGLPTFYYSYEQAVAEGNLVNYRVMEAQTRFQVVGIQGDALPEPLQAAVKEEGLLLEELSFEGTDIEKKVTNTGTNNAIAREFMDRCRKDVLGLPHKTIIFAVGHATPLDCTKASISFFRNTSGGDSPKSSTVKLNVLTHSWTTLSIRTCLALRSRLICSTQEWTFQQFRTWFSQSQYLAA